MGPAPFEAVSFAGAVEGQGYTDPRSETHTSGTVLMGLGELFVLCDYHRQLTNFERSKFIVHVGSLPKPILLLPSTSLPQVFVVGEAACGGLEFQQKYTLKGAKSGLEANNFQCSSSRGGLFNHKEDQSMKSIAQGQEQYQQRDYDLSSFQTFCYHGYNFSAFLYQSNVSSGYTSAIPLSRSIQAPIAEFINLIYTWLGLLGIDPRPASYTKNDGIWVGFPSLLTSMNATGIIPSISWAYTAGSYGRKLRHVLSMPL
jgi:hypothetical protein